MLSCCTTPYRIALGSKHIITYGTGARFDTRSFSAQHNKHGSDAPRIAILGSGPAGFYTAQKVMRDIPDTKIDMYEQLPVPFGLVRFGVAPDHPEVKNCQDTFQEVAASPNFEFIGNVNLGNDLPLPLISKNYDAIVFAYGASKDRKIGMQDEDKPQIYSARAFVGWYNGLPEYRDLDPDLSNGETAVVVGQGNVALDIARTLLSKIDTLKKTDMTSYAIERLATSSIKHVHVVGRRGPLQAAFTIKEIRELLQLDDVNFTPISPGLLPKETSKLPRPRKRIIELLKKGSTHKPDATKSWSLDFMLSPKALRWSVKDPNVLEGMEFTKMQLKDPLDPASGIDATDESEFIPCATVFRSVGYRAEALPGMQEIGADFDEKKGMLVHDGLGRMVSPQLTVTEHDSKASLYCAGWVKRGPTGVIASTMSDAYQTAEVIVEDWKKKYIDQNRSSVAGGWPAVKADAIDLNLNVTNWKHWKSIDRAERRNGEAIGKPREKFGTVKEMLEASQT